MRVLTRYGTAWLWRTYFLLKITGEKDNAEVLLKLIVKVKVISRAPNTAVRNSNCIHIKINHKHSQIFTMSDKVRN